MIDTAKQHSPDRQPSADIINSEVALKRAARKVWEEARLTGLPVVYMQDGEIMHSLDADLAPPDEA